MDLPARKPNRLKNYDYSTPGAYFITVCTRDRRHLFWNSEPPASAVGAAISRPRDGSGPAYTLSETGKIVETAIQSIPTVYPSVSVEKYIVMPNHIHMILWIHAGDSGRMISAPTISTVVGQMKRWAAKQSGVPLWQRSYYDHIIRGEEDHRAAAEYIDANPTRWCEDEFYTEI